MMKNFRLFWVVILFGVSACGWSITDPNLAHYTPVPQVDPYRGTPPPTSSPTPSLSEQPTWDATEEALHYPALKPTEAVTVEATSAAASLLRLQVLEALQDAFSVDELKELAFGLSIDFEDLPGETKSAKALSLVEICERMGRLDALIRDIKAARPQADIDLTTPADVVIQSRALALAAPNLCDLDGDGDCDGRDVEIMGRSMQTVNAPKETVTARPTTAATTQPTPRPTGTVTATPRPTVTAIPSTAPSATPAATVAPGRIITWAVSPFNYGDTPAQFNTVFELVKAATAKRPDLPACNESDPAIHPTTKWHGLVYFALAGDVVTPICHYSHQHGIDPNSGNSVFGEVGAWLGVPGQSVSGPQQTFFIPATVNDVNITPQQLAAQGVPIQMENDVKHTGYKWFVSTNSTCSATDAQSEFFERMCIVAFRVQFHQHSLLDFHIRFHSFTFEGKVCADPRNEATCGIRRLAGWAEHSRLFTPPENVRCWAEFQKEPPPGLINLPTDNQFYESPFTADTPPRDEFRCHWQINLQTVLSNPGGVKAIPEHMPSEWWIQTGGDTRLQIMSPNPITGPDSTGVAVRPYCQQIADVDPAAAAGCRWTGQKLHINTGYIMAVRAYQTFYFINGKTIDASDDVDGDGVLDAKRWTTRFGEFRTDTVCNGKAPSLDCLPDTWSGNMLTPHPLKRNADGTAYIDPATGKRVTLPTGYLQGVKDFRPSNQDTTVNVFDGDMTPVGVPSWIAETWKAAAVRALDREAEPLDMQELHEHNAP